MRKFVFILGLLLLGIAIASLVVWTNRANLVAHFLSRHLRVPVTIRTLEVTKTEADISRLWIGTPPKSKTSTSFSAETIAIVSNLDQIMGNPLTIDEINMANLFIGVEYYEGLETNWTYILQSKGENNKKKKERDYLIRTLILENLTVEVTQANGKIKRYPTIPRMEFHNISSDTGFPIDEIEKAIFNLMMQDLFKNLNIDQLLKQFPFPQTNPMKFLPPFRP